MAISPQTNVRLLKMPIEIDNKNQLTFASKQAQTTYFTGLTHIEIDNVSYQRKDDIIRYEAHIDSIMGYNYVMYQNENYGNKWFYAFIVDKKYINDNRTDIYIKTDVFQTWQFDITWKQSFIDREMINVANDTIGANRVVEGLETGEYMVDKSYNISDLDPYYVIAYVGDSFKISGGSNIGTPQRGYKYNGVYSSVCFIVANDSGFNYLMSHIADEDNSNNVLTIFTAPKFAFTIPTGSTSWTNDGYYVVSENMYTSAKVIDSTLIEALTTSDSFEGYTPKNKKVLQYPYVYLGFNPIVGNKKIFRYEDFRNFSPEFKLCSEINPNPNLCISPQNYKRENEQHGGIYYQYDCVEELSGFGGYPNVSYKTDVFNTWLAQNQDIINLSMQQEANSFQQRTANNILGLVQGATGGSMEGGSLASNGLGAISSGINQAFMTKNHELNIQMQMAQIEKQKMLPDQAVLSSNSTIIGYDLISKSIFCKYKIRREFAEKIDKYFDCYGYKTNMIKIPNTNNRPNWNYVKTAGANIIGDIPQEDMQQIKDIFDNGVTLWHNASTFLDYSQNNR